jgi:hypothetical protein
MPLPDAVASDVLHAIENDDFSTLNSYWSDRVLYATCRNNWLEFHVHRLVEEFGRDELSYLGTSHTLLADERLRKTICAVEELIVKILEWPALCASMLDGDTKGYTEREVLDAFAAPPKCLAEAFTRFETCRRWDEGDDLPTLAAFLYAHNSVLRYASTSGLTALYLLWLYG